jgi:hypothetical protein
MTAFFDFGSGVAQPLGNDGAATFKPAFQVGPTVPDYFRGDPDMGQRARCAPKAERPRFNRKNFRGLLIRE